MPKEGSKMSVPYYNGSLQNTVFYSNDNTEKITAYPNEKPIETLYHLNEKPKKTSGYSVDWYHITDGGNGKFTVYVDINSFRRMENIVTFWQKWVYNEDQKVTVGRSTEYGSTGYKEERKKTVVDCWNMESGTVFEAYYTEDNEFMWGNAYENPIFTPDVPDTFSYEIVEFVCGEAVPQLVR
jgi:hypothetical protein